MNDETWQHRTELLVGKDGISKLSNSSVIVFGVGGVGSWCVEGIARSGVRNITIVDPDNINITNINRQLPATHSTIGESKVGIMKQHILDINPEANVTALHFAYNPQTASNFDFNSYDIVIDAIDSINDKCLLILNATASSTTLFSSMGAALKLDPQHVRVAEFWKLTGCRLAASLRRKFKHNATFPSKKFLCVYSDETVKKATDTNSDVNGSVVFTTAIFGFNLASLCINKLLSK